MKTNIFTCIIFSLIAFNLQAQNASFSKFLLQVPTALHETTAQYFSFDVGDYNGDGRLDVYAIKQNGTDDKVEVHILNGADNFKTFLLQIATPLSGTEYGDFKLEDYNNDGKLDLLYTKVKLQDERVKGATADVNILDGANNFQSSLAQIAIANPHFNEGNHIASISFAFAFNDYNSDGKLDLYTIQETGNGTPMEVTILNGADNFQTLLLEKTTPLKQMYFEYGFAFRLGDYNKDGKMDIYAIKENNTGTKTTEVHILDGVNNFQSFLIQTGTVLPEANWEFSFDVGDYNNDGNPDIYAIKMKNTGSKKTEVHIF